MTGLLWYCAVRFAWSCPVSLLTGPLPRGCRMLRLERTTRHGCSVIPPVRSSTGDPACFSRRQNPTLAWWCPHWSCRGTAPASIPARAINAPTHCIGPGFGSILAPGKGSESEANSPVTSALSGSRNSHSGTLSGSSAGLKTTRHRTIQN